MRYFLFSLLFCLPLLKSHAAALDTIVIKENMEMVSSDGVERYFFNKTDLPIQAVTPQLFRPKDEVDTKYVDGWIWVKFIVKNTSNTNHFVLSTSSGHVSGLYMYKPSATGYHMTPPRAHHPEDGREVYNRLPAFFLDLKKGEIQTIYLKIRTTNELLNFNYVIRDYEHYVEYTETDYIIVGFYFGALLIIIFINFFYFISLKESLFLVYSAYVFGSFLFTASLDGFTWLLIPNPDAAYHVSYFSFRFWGDALLFFTMQLVNLKQRNQHLTNFTYGFIFYHSGIMAVLEYVNAFNIRENFMAQWETVNAVISIVLVFVIILLSYKNNKYLFKYYAFAFGILLIAITLLPFYAYGGAEHYLVFQHGLKAGTLIEMITLSFAVSRRFKLTEMALKEKKEEERLLNDKVMRLEMDIRKAQMNPHFMFNALTSIEYFILSNNSDQARNYLGKFSRLMRITLDHSQSNFVPLHDELNALKLYVELEFLRLKSHWHTFEIKTSEQMDDNNMFVPPLLIQPFVENAIWHGLQKKEREGKLLIDVSFIENELRCTVEDDGVGIHKELVTKNHKSSGICITKERLTLIHSILNTPYKFSIETITNEQEASCGTRVQFSMPHLVE